MSEYLSLIEYVSDGSQTSFPVPFPYIRRSYVKAYGIDSAGTGTAVPFTWDTPGTITLSFPVSLGDRVRIVRETGDNAPLVDFTNVSQLGRKELDLSQTQLLHLIQECREAVGAEMLGMENRVTRLLKEMEALVGAGDGELSARLDGLMDSILAARDAGALSAVEAKAYEYLSYLWANQTPGVEVDGGEFSSRHWADQAKAVGGDIADHVEAYDPHVQYLRKDQAGDGFFEVDGDGNISLLEAVDPSSEHLLCYIDAWGNVALK